MHMDLNGKEKLKFGHIQLKVGIMKLAVCFITMEYYISIVLLD